VFDRRNKLARTHRLHPDFVPGRDLSRHSQGMAAQDGGFRAKVGGSISDDGAVAIR